MQTQNAVAAANLLLQSAEAVLPRQRRTQAVTEFKHAKVAHKRRSKTRQEVEGIISLDPTLASCIPKLMWSDSISITYPS